ncbi:MAG TPA: 23S rRNA (adenine(2503)-C(2))-methyltransferase RlmN [Saprospiraceae bacterium]|nr:23S rRNA (adenine(2503)-C(2))-methyltransferase RlmN [Saprospiraceae bacterium]HND86692.1 23S rRNA (adenine(2503)-C(2))-methyltransferase RlmN [Saprospiraceae bacterium]HNG88801.1 23S rRNA (adenine(2503)-C(2))-methyltransferase RlmN [Saprospiraceae bacterium]
MTDIRTLDLAALERVLADWGEPRFRARQLYEWLWAKSATHFEAMTNLSKELRQRLSEQYVLQPLMPDKVQHSADGTIKSRWLTHDGHRIESVLIPVPEDERYTVCVSTQVGCSLTCKFCATGRMGRARNLSAAEIYDQVVLVNRQSLDTFGKPLTNVVYMGMGEPLLTYANTLESIRRLTSPEPHGLGMSTRRITVSTAGIAKMIRKLAEDGYRSNLALSLHAADDAKRNEIMPINETNHLQALMESLEYFYRLTKNRISYEYIAFEGFNDGPDDAARLVQLCRRRFPVRVNIIEYNPIDGAPFTKTGEQRLNEFAAHLARERVTVTVRRSRGRDIDAACGQLANKDIEDAGAERQNTRP